MRNTACLMGLAALAACEAPPPEPVRADWVIESRLAFVGVDGRTPRPAPREALRLWMPYVVGDLYGAPNAGEVAPVNLRPDLAFTVNLNHGHAKLGRALVPTEFSQRWMTLTPATARIARLSPFVLPADGIAPVGTSEWLDVDSGARLMLVYVDRPAQVRGEIVHEGRSLRFDIEAKEAGYLWVEQPRGDGVYRAVPRPRRLVLAVMPNA